MQSYFNRFTLEMTKNEANRISHRGECYEDCRAFIELPHIKRQFKKINPEDIRQELLEHGAWSKEELADNKENQIRIVWIAAGNILER